MANPLGSTSILRCTVITSDPPQVAEAVLHYQVTAVGGSPATDQDVCDTLDAAIATQWKALMATTTSYRGVITQIIAPGVPPVYVQSTANVGPGTDGATPNPKQSSLLVSWYTNLARPANRGRTYVGFPASNTVGADGNVLAAAVTALDTLAATIQALSSIAVGGRSATIKFSIYHRATKSTTPVISRVSRGVFATQKRRGSYGRTNTPPI